MKNVSLYRTKLHRLIHPMVRQIIKTYNRKKIVCLNHSPVIYGKTLYAVNHSCMWDVPIVTELLDKHNFLLAGKQKMDLSGRLAFILKGTIWVDRASRESKQKAYTLMKKLLEQGESLTIFPEATWNLEPSLPMLPMYWGIIQLSLQTNTPIQPIALEYVLALMDKITVYCFPAVWNEDNRKLDTYRIKGFDELIEKMSSL